MILKTKYYYQTLFDFPRCFFLITCHTFWFEENFVCILFYEKTTLLIERIIEWGENFMRLTSFEYPV